MDDTVDKENTAPLQLAQFSQQFGLSPIKHDKSRSKSIGPGGLEDIINTQWWLKDRRQSSVQPGVRGIIPDKEDAERKAARRKSMANRRVSFAPEATLHTWDVVEHMREHTASTDHSGNIRDVQADPASSQLGSDDDTHMSGMSESSELSGSDDAGSDTEENATTTGMSFVSEADITQASAVSGSSTSSSLDRNLRMAAEAAGTRGIEYDEHGDMSMEMAGATITNAFQPWLQGTEDRRGSATYDQENVDPFASYKTIQEDDMSMDVTRAIGGVLAPSSPFAEVPMDLTQVIGGVHNSPREQHLAQKRDWASMTNETTDSSPSRSKRRQSRSNRAQRSPARDEITMELTQAIGGIQASSRLSESSFDGNEELSMELTTVIGGIRGDLFDMHRGSVHEESSPFRVDMDPTMDMQPLEDEPDDPQSPTPKARSEVILRRSPSQVQNDELQSSPSQLRRSQRLQSSSPRSQVALQRTPEQTRRMEPAEVTPKDRQFSTPPSEGRRVTRSNTRSPRQAKQSSVTATPTKPPTPQAVTPITQTGTTPTEQGRIDQRSMLDAIRLMTTPRKETLRPVTPKKATPSPSKRTHSALRSGGRQISKPNLPALQSDYVHLIAKDDSSQHIHLQTFLDKAGIRFMDLTTSKRRLTTATTPSKLRQQADVEPEQSPISLEDAITAAACTEPELELFKHACHELKRYIDEGKSDIKVLEAETYKETPPLIQAYMVADAEKRALIDSQMRNIKTHARLRSKEMWYAWRSNLVDDLMKALGSIAEDLITDDEILLQKEVVLEQALPPLLEQRALKQREEQELDAVVNATANDDKEELAQARARLTGVDAKTKEKQRIILELQQRLGNQSQHHQHLSEQKKECIAVIHAAEVAKVARQSVTAEQAIKLKEAVSNLETDYEWSIVSASLNPAVLRLSYKKQLELHFHPAAFSNAEQDVSNEPIRLSYIANMTQTSTHRFFLQYLQAFLQALPQCRTRIYDMLSQISSAWDIALQVVETERLLKLEGPVNVSIDNDSCLSLHSEILLPAVRTKVCASFQLRLNVLDQVDVDKKALVKVVYGQPYNEHKMSDFLTKHTESGFESWPAAIRQLRTKLIERGRKTA